MNNRVFNSFKAMKVADLIRILEEYKEYNIQICENDGMIMEEIDDNTLALEGYWFGNYYSNVEDLNNVKIYNDLNGAEFIRRLLPYKNRSIQVCGNMEISITIKDNNFSINDISAELEV